MADNLDRATQSIPQGTTVTLLYGDGSELDHFEDLPVSLSAEGKFTKEPRVKLKLRNPYPCDGTELDEFDDLPVSFRTEARFYKAPSTMSASEGRFGKVLS